MLLQSTKKVKKALWLVVALDAVILAVYFGSDVTCMPITYAFLAPCGTAGAVPLRDSPYDDPDVAISGATDTPRLCHLPDAPRDPLTATGIPLSRCPGATPALSSAWTPGLSAICRATFLRWERLSVVASALVFIIFMILSLAVDKRIHAAVEEKHDAYQDAVANAQEDAARQQDIIDSAMAMSATQPWSGARSFTAEPRQATASRLAPHAGAVSAATVAAATAAATAAAAAAATVGSRGLRPAHAEPLPPPRPPSQVGFAAETDEDDTVADGGELLSDGVVTPALEADTSDTERSDDVMRRTGGAAGRGAPGTGRFSPARASHPSSPALPSLAPPSSSSSSAASSSPRPASAGSDAGLHRNEWDAAPAVTATATTATATGEAGLGGPWVDAPPGAQRDPGHPAATGIGYRASLTTSDGGAAGPLDGAGPVPVARTTMRNLSLIPGPASPEAVEEVNIADTRASRMVTNFIVWKLLTLIIIMLPMIAYAQEAVQSLVNLPDGIPITNPYASRKEEHQFLCGVANGVNWWGPSHTRLNAIAAVEGIVPANEDCAERYLCTFGSAHLLFTTMIVSFVAHFFVLFRLVLSFRQAVRYRIHRRWRLPPRDEDGGAGGSAATRRKKGRRKGLLAGIIRRETIAAEDAARDTVDRGRSIAHGISRFSAGGTRHPANPAPAPHPGAHDHHRHHPHRYHHHHHHQQHHQHQYHQHQAWPQQQHQQQQQQHQHQHYQQQHPYPPYILGENHNAGPDQVAGHSGTRGAAWNGGGDLRRRKRDGERRGGDRRREATHVHGTPGTATHFHENPGGPEAGSSSLAAAGSPAPEMMGDGVFSDGTKAPPISGPPGPKSDPRRYDNAVAAAEFADMAVKEVRKRRARKRDKASDGRNQADRVKDA